jgi:hypothetical protein
MTSSNALIAAPVARAVPTGAVVSISAGHERDAELEGWIRLPSDRLSSLVAPSR